MRTLDRPDLRDFGTPGVEAPIAALWSRYGRRDGVARRRGRRTDPRTWPIFSPDFTDVSPAIIAVAGFDPLGDSGAAYADKLDQAGGSVTLRY